MEGLGQLGQALLGLLNGMALFNVAWATLLGIGVGALPGLTATLGVALLTTLTYKMAPDQAILVLICMYVGAIYGGSRSAILLNIPGTPASAATKLFLEQEEIAIEVDGKLLQILHLLVECPRGSSTPGDGELRRGVLRGRRQAQQNHDVSQLTNLHNLTPPKGHAPRRGNDCPRPY
jgi:hypothetical protein